jgi:hypothetical protein
LLSKNKKKKFYLKNGSISLLPFTPKCGQKILSKDWNEMDLKKTPPE